MVSQYTIILFISLFSTYFFFMYTGGFTKIIQKCFHLKGNMNNFLNTYLFMVLVSVVIKTFQLYTSLLVNKTEEGFEKGGQEKDAAMVRLKSLEELVVLNYKKHGKMKKGKKKEELLNKIRRYQSKINELNRKLIYLR